MTDQDRKALAESLWANPLFGLLLDEMEETATQSCVWAQTDQERLIAALRVQSIQRLRDDCKAALQQKPESKKAPA